MTTSDHTWAQLPSVFESVRSYRAPMLHRVEPGKGVEPSPWSGWHRWQVERAMAWPAGCRRLHRRYESKTEHF